MEAKLSPARAPVGRFAPTPSGFLHLGNVFCSLLAWLYAKSRGGRIILRVEDLDARRCPRENARVLAQDLLWLGLAWDEGAFCGERSESFFQSGRGGIYARYFAELEARGLVYPCFCSRNELHAAEAPHLSDGSVLYAGTCRGLSAAEREARARLRPPAYRLKVDDTPISFDDGHYGVQAYDLTRSAGDFIIRRSDGVFAYQLAVTIDDALMGVTQVVRGSDLLSSTAMQLYIYRLLGFAPPAFCHVPLLVDAGGRRLSKRDGDLEIAVLRKRLGSPEPLIGYLAYLAGQLPKPEPLAARDLLPLFRPEKIPHEPIVADADLIMRTA